MKARNITLLLAALLTALTANAQIKGRIVLADGSPATYATALLYADSNTSGTPRSYALTDAKGAFTIKDKPAAGMWLVVRYLGYKEYREPLPLPATGLEIRLQTDVQRLNAVKVEAKMKSVEVSGDTIRFYTDYFKTGAEDNAAEVLNKIPGMEVDDNGGVSYAGKKVDRVTVDGRDIFNSGSDGALNTMSADAIKGAEILRDAKDNSLVDNFVDRERTTLNLKTDGRARANGKINAMGGIMDKWNSENSLLFIGKKMSLNASLSANNTGETVFSFKDYLTQFVGLDNLLSGGINGFSISDDELMAFIAPTNVNKAVNGITTLSGTWRPSEKLKIKGNVMANGKVLDAESWSRQEYFTQNLVNLHQQVDRSINTFASTSLQETWKPRKELELSNRTRIVHTTAANDDSLTESGLSAINTFANSDMRKTGIEDEAVLNIKIGENLLSAHLFASHTRRNYCYDLLTDQSLLPATFYTAVDSMLAINTNKEVRQTTLSPDITYAVKLGKKLTLNTSLLLSRNAASFDYSPETGDSVHASLTTDMAAATVKLHKNKGLFRLSLGLKGVAEHYTSTIDDIDGSSKYALLPEASVGLAFSSTHRLDLSASMSQNAIELQRLIRQPLVESYNSLFDGSYIVDPHSRASNASLSYYINDIFSSTTFFASAGITQNTFSVKPYTTQDSTIFTTTHYDNNGESSSLYVRGELSKGLGAFPADARLGGTISRNVSQTTVNVVDGDVISSSLSGSLSIVTRSKKAINGELGLTYSHSGSHYSQNDATTSNSYQYSAYGAFIVSTKKFSATIRLNYSNLSNSFIARDVFNVSFRSEYKIKKWRLTLRGSNVLNIDEMEWLRVSSTPYYISTTRYREIPGYLLLGAGYRF